jgi:hypothetical protein
MRKSKTRKACARCTGLLHFSAGRRRSAPRWQGAPARILMLARGYFCSFAAGGGGGVFCAVVVGPDGSLMPFKPSLKPFRPSPSPFPNSGSLLAPKSRNATTASTIRCHGCNKSPIFQSSAHHLAARLITDYCRTSGAEPCPGQFTRAGLPSRSVTIVKKLRRSSSSPMVRRR